FDVDRKIERAVADFPAELRPWLLGVLTAPADDRARTIGPSAAQRCRRRRTAEQPVRNRSEVVGSPVGWPGRRKRRPLHCPCCPAAQALAGPEGATAMSSPGEGPPFTVVQLDPSQCAASGVVDTPTPTTHASSGRDERI